MGESKIEWTNATWNPIRGCSLVSAGCTNCYAMKSAHRMSSGAYKGLTRLGPNGPVWTGDVRFVPEMLDYPLRLKKPHMIFVNSMSDLFHEGVTDQQIVDIFGMMALAHWHTFQILTKRPDRMRDFLSAGDHGIIAQFEAIQRGGGIGPAGLFKALDVKRRDKVGWQWPLPNVWPGVSCEDQKSANERVPLLLETPAAVRWVSAEPLLGPLSLAQYYREEGQGTYSTWLDRLDWVVVGGESGAGARPCHLGWIDSLVAQCRGVDIPVFVKQLGRVPVMDEAVWRASSPVRLLNPHNDRIAPVGTVPIAMSDLKGHNIDEFPLPLQVRQYPDGALGGA